MALYDRRKRLATDAPLDYQRSRAADREIYGSRAIDGSAPMSTRSGTGAGVGERPMKGGLTPEASWRGFFDRPKPVGATAMPSPVSVSTFPEMGMEKGMRLSDPSQAFRVAGAPPIGGPVTSPMPTTPTAMQYYEEGIKGSGFQPSVFGKEPVSSAFYTHTKYGKIGVSNQTDDPQIADFFKRYRRA